MVPMLAARIINRLPEKTARKISKRATDIYIDKHAIIHISGKENLQNIQKPTLFVCNHLSNADGLILCRTLSEIDPTFVAGVKLSNNAVTNMGIMAVKTTTIEPDTPDKDGIKRIIELMKKGESIVIFPEGTRSRTGMLIEAKKGVLLVAQMTGAPIVPLGLCGTEKLLPISKEEKMGEEKFHNAEVTVCIGKQFTLPQKQEGQDRKEYQTMTMNYIMKKVAALLPEKYRGVYQ